MLGVQADSLNLNFTSPEHEKAAQSVIPSNTEANTKWAVRTFNAWGINRSFLNLFLMTY